MNDAETKTNGQKLGTFVQDAMERMETDLPDSELGEIMLVCEFRRQRKDGTGYTTVRTLCSDAREFIQLGLLRTATLAVETRKAQ